MHVGVAGCRPNISIETKAKNGPYDKLDVLKKKRSQGPFVDGPKEIKTSLDYEKCIESGANDYLPKPVNLTNLFTILKVWLPIKQ